MRKRTAAFMMCICAAAHLARPALAQSEERCRASSAQTSRCVGAEAARSARSRRCRLLRNKQAENVEHFWKNSPLVHAPTVPFTPSAAWTGRGPGAARASDVGAPRTGEPAGVVTDEGCESRAPFGQFRESATSKNQATPTPHQHTSLPIGGKAPGSEAAVSVVVSGAAFTRSASE